MGLHNEQEKLKASQQSPNLQVGHASAGAICEDYFEPRCRAGIYLTLPVDCELNSY